jgi:hypothetical protein
MFKNLYKNDPVYKRLFDKEYKKGMEKVDKN